MELSNKVAIVTGGGSGTDRGRRAGAKGSGRALRCQRGGGHPIAGRDDSGTLRSGRGLRVECWRPRHLGGIELEDSLWTRMWEVHGMAHVWAARAVIPEMVERREGYFLITSSAAGLLNIPDSAPYV